MHTKILRAGRPGSLQRFRQLTADNRADDITEQRQLCAVDNVAKCRDRPATRSIDPLCCQNRAGIDPSVDQMQVQPTVAPSSAAHSATSIPR